MKKIFFYAPIAAFLTLASCAQDDMPTPSDGGNVTFKISLPSGMGTRAFSDGTTAEDLDIAIFDAKTNDLVQIPTPVKFNGELSTTVNLELANGRAYKIAFFAHKKGSAYTFDAPQKRITVDYSAMRQDYNTDNYDCFYTLYTTPVISDALNDNITLTRPVAQLNWGTSDLNHNQVVAPSAYDKDETGEAKNLWLNVKSVTAYTQFDMLESDVVEGSEQAVELGFIARPKGEFFPAKGESFKYLSMCYMFMPKAGTNVDVVTLQSSNSATGEPVMTNLPVTNVPLQANYRTNIYGALLTSPADLTISKDTVFEGIYNIVTTPKQLEKALEEGGNIALNSDIALENVNLSVKKDVNLHLIDNKINITGSIHVSEGATMNIDGKEGSQIVGDKGQNVFEVHDNSALNIDGVNLQYSKKFPGGYTFISVQGKDFDVTVKNCNALAGAYFLSTNATNPNQNGKVYFENVTVRGHHDVGSPMMINIPLDFTAKDCQFYGEYHAFIMRGGNYDFTNCTFNLTLEVDDNNQTITPKEEVKDYRNAWPRNRDWGTGNMAVLSAVTMGNRSVGTNSYRYPTSVTMKGCTINIPAVAQLDEMGIEYSMPAVYAYANAEDGMGVTFTYDSATKINGAQEYASPNIIVNGVSTQNYTEK